MTSFDSLEYILLELNFEDTNKLEEPSNNIIIKVKKLSFESDKIVY